MKRTVIISITILKENKKSLYQKDLPCYIKQWFDNMQLLSVDYVS